MNCLMQIVISFQDSIVPELRKLIKSGNEINMKFNETLKQELVPIMLSIEDGYLGGKCNIEYDILKDQSTKSFGVVKRLGLRKKKL
jgi:hypothetical protein